MAQQTMIIAKNTIDNIVEIFVRNASNGKPVTGVTPANVSIRAWERGQAGSSVTAIPIAGTIDLFVSNGWVEVDAVNLKGVYQYSIPNTVLQATSSQIDINFEFVGANDENAFLEIVVTAVPINTGVQVAPNGWDALAIESLTAKQAFQLMASVLCGETSGAETSKTIFKAIDDNAVQRLTSESDDKKNRTKVEVFI